MWVLRVPIGTAFAASSIIRGFALTGAVLPWCVHCEARWNGVVVAAGDGVGALFDAIGHGSKARLTFVTVSTSVVELALLAPVAVEVLMAEAEAIGKLHSCDASGTLGAAAHGVPVARRWCLGHGDLDSERRGRWAAAAAAVLKRSEHQDAEADGRKEHRAGASGGGLHRWLRVLLKKVELKRGFR